MPRINYTQLLTALEQVVREDADIVASQAAVFVQQPVPMTLTGPTINIFEDRYDATPGQALAASTRWRCTVTWNIWVTCFSADSYKDAAAQRDELLGKVQTALMRNSTLAGALEAGNLFMRGGEIGRGGPAQDIGFIAQATLGLSAEVVATTP